MKDGLPPNAEWGIKSVVRMPQGTLKATMAHLAAQGPRDFYQGDLARSIAADIQAAGGALSVEDLAAFRAHLRDPLQIPYRGGNVYATPELTAGPTLAHTMRLLQQKLKPGSNGPDAAAYTEYALALQSAYRERLSDMGDADGRRALGAEHLAPACTTHFSVVDKDGNMAAVTQTLLSTFGSKFVTPKTGLTMNNGIMWFDPTQGVPNSLAPGKRCLTNYTPVVAQAADGRRFAVGASGGRRILPAVAQLLSFVMDYGMDLDTAIHTPRIDASEGDIVIGDVRLPQPARQALRKQFDYEESRIQTFPMKFACPSVVLRDGAIEQRRDRIRPAVGRCGGGRLVKEVENDTHIGRRRLGAPKGRVNDAPAGIDGGRVAQFVGRFENGPGRIQQGIGRPGRLGLIDDHVMLSAVFTVEHRRENLKPGSAATAAIEHLR